MDIEYVFIIAGLFFVILLVVSIFAQSPNAPAPNNVLTPNTPALPVPNLGQCGVTKPILKIIAGTQAYAGKWPWQAIIQCQTLCGGTLIEPSWILSAAHCLPTCTLSNIIIILGANDLTKTENFRQVFKAIQLFPHPQYNMSTKDNDICLIKLSKPAVITAYVSTVCLPEKIYDLSKFTLYTTGFGVSDLNGEKQPSTTLQETTTVYNAGLCREFSQNSLRLCTHNAGGGVGGLATGTCYGDSGGPLVLQDGVNWVQVGITSYGYNVCAELPTIYTSVYEYRDFIKQTIASNP